MLEAVVVLFAGPRDGALEVLLDQQRQHGGRFQWLLTADRDFVAADPRRSDGAWHPNRDGRLFKARADLLHSAVVFDGVGHHRGRPKPDRLLDPSGVSELLDLALREPKSK